MIDTSFRKSTVTWQLFNYQNSKSIVEEFQQDCLQQTKKENETGISAPGNISNPTLRGAMLLLNPPKSVAMAEKWCKVIERVWDEFREEDAVAGREFGIAYLFEKAYCLTGAPRTKEQNAKNRAEICSACQIALRTFYTWLNRCVETTTYYAAKEGLI